MNDPNAIPIACDLSKLNTSPGRGEQALRRKSASGSRGSRGNADGLALLGWRRIRRRSPPGRVHRARTTVLSVLEVSTGSADGTAAPRCPCSVAKG